ncbi:hypothetical protein QBC46DRAFT_400590 [Diplogelasinospora grovesii]|uniref:Rhodopsin domain-containing protein n=1 Tax=Diplogelasinospora grovesii TaxID=303347 RepID=A0AAN6MXL9_9PEZI|nr:hypothetical protein QBC46DRAFT_400590 [Diplogelasinospora grovesii]
MAPAAGWHPIEPTGLARSILAVAITFTILSFIVLSLRVAIRIRLRIFAIEDWLMCIGFVINTAHNAVIAYGTFTGLGTPDDKIPGGVTGPIYMEGIKSVVLWQIFFLSGFVFIKCSICLTLLRIAVIKWQRVLLHVLMAVTSVVAIFVTIYVLAQCQPIERAWGEKPGTCLPNSISVVITFVVSAINLVTDFTTAILPFLMLRNVQMTRNRKIAVTAVLSLGVLASIATIARLPYGTAYFSTTNYLVGLGEIILWTILECDLALIAGSLPMLRTLFSGLRNESTKGSYSNKPTELSALPGRMARHGYHRHEDDAKTLESGEKSESRKNIMVTQEHTIIHEDRSSDNDVSPPYQARTYV